MKIHFEVDKIGNLDDYINLPITKDNNVIGVIQTITELENTYLLSGYIWSKYMSCDFEINNNRLCSMEILE